MNGNNDLANFSANVGNSHGPNWRKWLSSIAGMPYMRALELGTWRGESAEWLLDNVLTHKESEYFCVDTFQGSEEHRLAGIDCSDIEQQTRKRLKRFGDRVCIIKGYSHLVMKQLDHEFYSFDFIYIDAAHDACNVMRDAVMAFELLKDGGVMVFDDYEWKAMRDEIDRPKLAIDSFLTCYARQIEVIGMGWQIAIRKMS